MAKECLINLVHARPAIWDKKSSQYSDRITKGRIWEEIFQDVTPNWTSMNAKQRKIRGKKIITRWTSIRDRFRRELNEEAEQSRSGAGTSQKRRRSPFFEMLGFLRSVMDLRSTSTNISEMEEEEGNSESGTVIQTPESVQDPITSEHGAEQLLSSETSTQPPACRTDQERQERQHVPNCSVRATTSRQRGGQSRPDIEGAMIQFMEDMRERRRAESRDPFSDPANQDAVYLRSLYHQLAQVPMHRKMEVHMSLFNFTGVCVRAAIAGDPMPPLINEQQRPYQHPYALDPAPLNLTSRMYHHQYPTPHQPTTGVHNAVTPPQVAPYYQDL
ncbi:hypothetical protein AB205_0168760 [Aquarana catesbeiana]|uniref:MADF domain-containing protein n=2 Tax=Aquarana catesbeiana TaxID=8400 RepID=A0A2G9R766_AQUCT|nr:hypothetical protein AB205_0168760 [Aquarana catesbeiana]